jgi:hypothetical protein
VSDETTTESTTETTELTACLVAETDPRVSVRVDVAAVLRWADDTADALAYLEAVAEIFRPVEP